MQDRQKLSNPFWAFLIVAAFTLPFVAYLRFAARWDSEMTWIMVIVGIVIIGRRLIVSLAVFALLYDDMAAYAGRTQVNQLLIANYGLIGLFSFSIYFGKWESPLLWATDGVLAVLGLIPVLMLGFLSTQSWKRRRMYF